jgi:hypothetical protein
VQSAYRLNATVFTGNKGTMQGYATQNPDRERGYAGQHQPGTAAMFVNKERAEGWVTFRELLSLEGEQRGLNPRPPDPQSREVTYHPTTRRYANTTSTD